MKIIKSDGKSANFDDRKLVRAMRRARVDDGVAKSLIEEISKMIRPGTSTQEIHTRALHMLEQRDPVGAARFNLKHAMLALGPSGYPFEHYFAQIMKAYGWSTQVGATVPGRCIEHEVDIYAHRGGEKRAVEAKYHNRAGGKTDVKTALYVHARHLDLTANDENIVGALVTNTSFTQDAILYGECVGMKMKGWNYPKDEGLAKYIEQKELYPITVFSHLKQHAVSKLTKDGIVMANQLCRLSHSDAARYGISSQQLESMQVNATRLCRIDS